MELEFALDVQAKMEHIVEKLQTKHLNQFRIICMRSKAASARAYARIWNLPKIWQKALGVQPFYVIEVLSQHFDKLSEENQEKTIIHELLHIPKGFTGGLVPHRCNGRRIDDKTVTELHRRYKEISEELHKH